MADTLRNKALSGYVCISLTSMNHGHQEITVSYWPNIEAVSHGKNDDLHLQALQMGREKWVARNGTNILVLI
jgi:heme-degrading monooxygenase HmoA